MLAITAAPSRILQKDVNIVLSPRRVHAPDGLHHALRALPEWSLSVTASKAELPTAAARLLEPLCSLELRAALHSQLVDLASEYCTVLGLSAVEATLEHVKGVTCPRFHADSVGVRCLCTLSGPGTLWVEDRYVNRTRLRSLPREDREGWTAIRSPAAVRQAAPGEVLYLKGSQFPGAEGRGAVHRSPDTAGGTMPRLLFKLDAPSWPVGGAHGAACAAGCAH